MLLTAPGKMWQTPVVATVSAEPVEHDLRGRDKGVLSLRHQDRSSVAAFAFNSDPHSSRRGDIRDDAQRHSFPFQDRTLLDV